MNGLVLSLFPGIGLLDMAFELEGFCVVRGPDLLWGGDVRKFHPPAGRFDGIIGGPPCQRFSQAANIVRSRGREQAPDMIPEFTRVVREAGPAWWIMENVPQAPIPEIEGYETHNTLINNRWFGGIQRRKRRISSNLKLLFQPAMWRPERETPTASTSVWKNGRQTGAKSRADYEIFREWQGLPADFEIPPFRVDAAVKAVVNGVPLPMGRAIAQAVLEAFK